MVATLKPPVLDKGWNLPLRKENKMSLNVHLMPSRCKHCGCESEGWTANITHNLIDMALEAGIYEVVWHPEKAGVTKAEQLITPLREAVAAMKADPARFERYEYAKGVTPKWGSYKNFVPWLEAYLEACEARPEARVSTTY